MRMTSLSSLALLSSLPGVGLPNIPSHHRVSRHGKGHPAVVQRSGRQRRVIGRHTLGTDVFRAKARSAAS